MNKKNIHKSGFGKAFGNEKRWGNDNPSPFIEELGLAEELKEVRTKVHCLFSKNEPAKK